MKNKDELLLELQKLEERIKEIKTELNLDCKKLYEEFINSYDYKKLLESGYDFKFNKDYTLEENRFSLETKYCQTIVGYVLYRGISFIVSREIGIKTYSVCYGYDDLNEKKFVLFDNHRTDSLLDWIIVDITLDVEKDKKYLKNSEENILHRRKIIQNNEEILKKLKTK